MTLFSNQPRDLNVTVRLADPRDLPPTPGTPVGRFAFEVLARLPDGTELRTLPAEARLSARYTDEESTGLDRNRLELVHLNPATREWETAPKGAGDPRNNYVSATVTGLGTYAIHQRGLDDRVPRR
jgi:hypothetical protein